VLLGRFVDDAMRVERVCFSANIRETNDSVLQEFDATIIPRFGACYANGRRGYWCEPKELLRITTEAEGLEVLGSIHLHPDWHLIGPPHERGLRVSQEPTPMDRHLFHAGGWPLNVILYLERREGRLYHSFGAWAPPADAGLDTGCRALAIRGHPGAHRRPFARARAHATGTRRGRTAVHVAPWPGALSTWTRPPIASSTCFTIHSPQPEAAVVALARQPLELLEELGLLLRGEADAPVPHAQGDGVRVGLQLQVHRLAVAVRAGGAAEADGADEPAGPVQPVRQLRRW